MAIPQDNMGKVKTGQEVLVKLKSYPYEEYGILE
jgi:HlyD family secretion protein